MVMWLKRGIFLTLTGIGALVSSGIIWAQDPVVVAPDIYKVILDNNQVRVLDITLKPGQVSPNHSHPGYVVYVLGPGKAQFTPAGGTAAELEMATGQAIWRDAETHSVKNTGSSTIHVLNVELKDALGPSAHSSFTPSGLVWGELPPGLPKGAQLAVLAGNPAKPGLFTVRLKTPAGYTIPPHWHSADEHVTVISGTVHLAMGDTLDKTRGNTLSAGGYEVMPAMMHHYAWSEGEAVVQIHGMGPFSITYINPTDDPRNQASTTTSTTTTSTVTTTTVPAPP